MYIVGNRWFVERSQHALKRQHKRIPDGDDGINIQVNHRDQCSGQSSSYSDNRCFGGSLLDKQFCSNHLSENMLHFKGGIKEPSSPRDLFISEVLGVLGMLEASWTFDTLSKMTLVFAPPFRSCLILCCFGQEEKGFSGSACPSWKCRPWWRIYFLTNAHVYHFSILPIWSTPHPTSGWIKTIPQSSSYPWPLLL